MQRTDPASSRIARGPKALSDCDAFAALARQASEREALDRALRQTLPTPLREQVQFADLRNDRLVFLATSPAWASRLRLMQTQLLAIARALGTRAGSVTVKVAPRSLPATTTPQRSRPLSAAAAKHLKATAASVKDPQMRALFLQLASFAEKADSP